MRFWCKNDFDYIVYSNQHIEYNINILKSKSPDKQT